MARMNKRQRAKLADIKESFRVLRVRYRAGYIKTEEELFKTMQGLEEEMQKFINEN